MATTLRTITSTTSYVSLESRQASKVDILNNSGEVLFIQLAGDTGTGKEISLADGQSCTVPVIANASEVQIKGTAGAAGVQTIVS